MAWITPRRERRVFQIVVIVAAIVPISAGAAGAVLGPDMIRGFHDGPIDLDSHFRYLSGLLFAIGVAFATIVGRIERHFELFRALCLIVTVGGLARLLGALQDGFAGGPHRFALVMELIVVPLLFLWLGRIERLSKKGS